MRSADSIELAFTASTYSNPVNLTLDGLVFMRASFTRVGRLFFTGTRHCKG